MAKQHENTPQIPLTRQSCGQCDCGGGDCACVGYSGYKENDASPALAIQQPTLTSWLHITDHCNLRCSYCYLPHRKQDMSDKTGKTGIAATFRSAIKHNYRQVKLKYAGGEPLLRFLLITELHLYAQQLAEQHELLLDGVILSNGTLLTTKIIHVIQKLGLRLMISLDGLGRFHDQQRAYANGRGSADDVLRSIELALEYALIPDISITVSGQNIEGLPELIGWILERDLPFSLNFYRDHDNSQLATRPFDSAQDDSQLETEKTIAGMLAAYKVIGANLPRRSLLTSLTDRANLAVPHLRPCSAGQSYLVFDTQGKVAKCQMQMDKLVTTTDAADPLSAIRADTTGIQNYSVEEKAECRDCQWNYWCAGSCPLTAFRATGRYDAKSPNCEVYKALFPEIIRLEGLRLMKCAEDP